MGQQQPEERPMRRAMREALVAEEPDVDGGEKPPFVQAIEEIDRGKAANRAFREKFDAQKKCLQKMVVARFERGKITGFEPDEVAAIHEALVVLGWIPVDLKV